MNTHTTTMCTCPQCGYKFDRATSVARGQPLPPRPDDITICLKCAAVLRFNADLSVRRMTGLELDELELETYARVAEIRNAILLRPIGQVRQ